MRQPQGLAAESQGDGEYTLCLLANLFFMFGIHEEMDTQEVRDKLLDPTKPYRQAGELAIPLFLLREGGFRLHAIGLTDISGRLERWLGHEAYAWLEPNLVETPRRPIPGDVETHLDEGWTVIATVGEIYGSDHPIPASTVLIAGKDHSLIYSPAGDGEPLLYESDPFRDHWDPNQGIIALRLDSSPPQA